MAVKTNLLYDAVLIPDIGVGVLFGEELVCGRKGGCMPGGEVIGSIIIGVSMRGDVELRRWFGRRALEKPFSGHHVGLYGRIVTYDFELGGKGYLGINGVTGEAWLTATRYLWDIGSMWISRWESAHRGGSVQKEYIPLDGHYVWQTPKNRRWFRS